MYSTANERGLISQPPFCLPCGKVQAGRPRSVGLVCFSGSQVFRLCSFRFAGVSPAFLLKFFVTKKLSRLSLMSHLSLKNYQNVI
ncbi:MAG: hypothetical protein LBP59_20290 [Planctomycetaceae bacterium]|nr:hypothetical protein [Planctomycetaceae bacterium]